MISVSKNLKFQATLVHSVRLFALESCLPILTVSGHLQSNNPGHAASCERKEVCYRCVIVLLWDNLAFPAFFRIFVKILQKFRTAFSSREVLDSVWRGQWSSGKSNYLPFTRRILREQPQKALKLFTNQTLSFAWRWNIITLSSGDNELLAAYSER